MRAVYNWTVVAPASRQAIASAAVVTPPQALMGTAAPTSFRTSPIPVMVRSVSGGPDRPPRLVDSLGSSTGSVLKHVRPDAPPSTAARARARTSAGSSVGGGSLTNSGLVVRG